MSESSTNYTPNYTPDYTPDYVNPRNFNKRVPAFNIVPPNPLTGTNVMIIMNAEMSRIICDMIGDIDLNMEEIPVHALARGLRRYYGQIIEYQKDKISRLKIDPAS